MTDRGLLSGYVLTGAPLSDEPDDVMEEKMKEGGRGKKEVSGKQ